MSIECLNDQNLYSIHGLAYNSTANIVVTYNKRVQEINGRNRILNKYHYIKRIVFPTKIDRSPDQIKF